MKNKELWIRIISVLFITCLTGIVLYFSHYKWMMIGVVILLSDLAVYELYNAMGYQKNYPLLIISILLETALCCVHVPDYSFYISIVFPITLFSSIVLMITQSKKVVNSPFKAVIIVIMVCFLFQSMKELRFIKNGLYYLTFAILTSVYTDIFAYIWGKIFGHHKMAPVISPKKTWEGSIGGTLSAVLLVAVTAYITQKLGYINVNFQQLALATVMTSIISQLGDLSMSSIKRVCGIKDYGTIIPGHGGILDRFDSHLYAIPFTLIFATYLLDFID